MNKQQKSPTKRGIEWATHTWNVVGGCKHGCRWDMPDGSTAICYAEEVATALRSDTFYPQGFEHHYWQPQRLDEPLKLKKPAKIFLDSMSDLMGHWVPDEQIEAVLNIARKAHWHTFQLLTKNHVRLRKFEFPDNVWVGVSAPPTHMNGKPLSLAQRWKFVAAGLNSLDQTKAKVKWMSIEPLSFDIAAVMERWCADNGMKGTLDIHHDWGVDEINTSIPRALPISWAVVGAATHGPKVYQPEPQWVEKVVRLLRLNQAAIFFKGNLRGNEAADPWLEEFPS